MICLCLNTHAIFWGTVSDKALTITVRRLRHFAAFLVLCAIEAVLWFLLFGSERLLKGFGLASVAQEWRSFFSLAFILVSFLVILWIIEFFSRQVLDKWEER